MDTTRFIVVGGFVDGTGADLRRNVFLAVKDGVIVEIGQLADLPTGDAALIDDFSHCTILPTLVDCSLSLARSPSVDIAAGLLTTDSDAAKKKVMTEQHIRYCYDHGVLGVGEDGELSDLRQRSRTGGAQENLIDIRTPCRLCRSGKDWALDDSTGGDYLKIRYSGNIEDEEARFLRLGHEDLRRIIGSKGGKKVIVVANGPESVAEALDAGCDAIEQGYLMGEDNLRKMAERNVLWIPSVLRAKNALDGVSSGGSVCCRFSQRYVAPGKPLPGAEEFWKKMLAAQLKQLRLAGKIGVQTALGTGAGTVGILHGESVVEEMKLFLKAGYSREETIRSGSENGARFFGMEQLGALQVGRRATFLISRGTMQQLPRKLSYLEGIYTDGLPSTTYRKDPVKAV